MTIEQAARALFDRYVGPVMRGTSAIVNAGKLARLRDAIELADSRAALAAPPQNMGERAEVLVMEILKEHRHDDPRDEAPVCGSCENMVAVALTTAHAEGHAAQRKVDAEIARKFNAKRVDDVGREALDEIAAAIEGSHDEG